MMVVLFPPIMKIEMTGRVSIHDCNTLADVKKKIYETCKTTIEFYSTVMQKHFRARNISVRDTNHFEIMTMVELMERIQAGPNFEVVFIDYPNG